MRAVFGRPIRWLWGAIGVATMILGFAGVPDDLATWLAWFGAAGQLAQHPQIVDILLALRQILDQTWPRLVLVVLGVIILIWPAHKFWRFRHRLIFKWRRLMSETVWISETEAQALVRNSPWARLKEPSVSTSVSIFDGIAGVLQRERVDYGMSSADKALLKFDLFIDRTLEGFGQANPSACRTSDAGVKEIDETALRLFLKRAMDNELLDEFGETPRFRVT